jgi:predicted site-specific integrase-resolvase
MKLSDYAKKVGVSYRTAWNWFKAGQIVGAYKLPSGTIIVPDQAIPKADQIAKI